MSDRFDFPRNPDELGGSDFDSEKLTIPERPDVRKTSAWRRFGSIFVDWMLPWIMFFWIAQSLADLVWLLTFLNSVVLQGKTGASVGKRMFGLQLAWVPTDKRESAWDFVVPGVGRCAFRYFAHILDCVLLLGLFKAMWNVWGKTFADEMAQTFVVWDDRIILDSREEYLDRIGR